MLWLLLLTSLVAAAAGDTVYLSGTEAADPGPSLDTVYQPGTAGADWSGEEVETTRERILQAINPTTYSEIYKTWTVSLVLMFSSRCGFILKICWRLYVFNQKIKVKFLTKLV